MNKKNKKKYGNPYKLNILEFCLKQLESLLILLHWCILIIVILKIKMETIKANQ